MPAKKKKTVKKTAYKRKPAKKVVKEDPVADQIGRLQPKLLDGLSQARNIVDTQLVSVDSVFRHRLECATQRAAMEQSSHNVESGRQPPAQCQTFQLGWRLPM